MIHKLTARTMTANKIKRSNVRTASVDPEFVELQERKKQAASLPFIVLIFMISIVVPVRFYIGSVLMMPFRVVLLISLIPCFIGFFSGRAGRIVVSDVFIILFWIWASIAIISVHGFSQIEGLGMHFLETVVPYLVARVYVRNADQFEAVARVLLRIIVILVPFAIYESITGVPIIITVLGEFTLVPANIAMDKRMGLDRAQVTFEHPILFGMFAASGIALSLYALNYRRPIKKNIRYVFFIMPAVICSASTGAFLSSVVQLISTYWDRQKTVKHNRWKIFFAVILLAYFVVDAISNRSPFQVFVSYLTFNPGSSGWRLLIWEYGSAEVWRHPLFGIGFNDWIRPAWMHSASVDNFWLLNAMRYGLPGLLLLCTAIFAIVSMLSRLKQLSRRLNRYRSGYLICISSLMVGMCTVHIWSAAYVWFMFLLGSAHWLANAPQIEDGGPVAAPGRLGYNRRQSGTDSQ